MVDQVTQNHPLFAFHTHSEWLALMLIVKLFSSINRLSMESVRDLLNLMKQNGTQISKSADEIAEKYNAKIVFKPGKKTTI